jgi:hypothetical protein
MKVTNTSTAHKTEPISRAVPPAYPAELGILESRRVKIPMYEGRGLEAPMAGQSIHKCGSQGRY